jgi:amino-acid N-acetyltransferase
MEIRQACLADVPGIAHLVTDFAERGEILPRTLEQLYQTVREWVVAEHAGRIVGCASLAILWADLAEIRSLVVDPAYQGMGVGRRMVGALLGQAAFLDIPQVFALTRKPGFFDTLGFHVVPRDNLPRKIWKDCLTCCKFVGCDEVAVLREVEGNGRLDGWMDGWVEEWKVGRLEGWKNGRVEGLEERKNGRPEEWKAGRMKGWMEELEGWKNGNGNRSSNLPIFQPSILPSTQGADDDGHSPD